MVNKYDQNHKKDCKQKLMKDIKIFLKNKKTKGEKKAQERYENFTEEKKRKKTVSIKRNISKS